MNLSVPLKKPLKRLFRGMLYRFPPVFISPVGLNLWFEALSETNCMDGDVVEIGCYLGGTAALSARFLREIGSDHNYFVIDTFAGFREDQFERELKLGGAASLRHHFSANSLELARWVMNRHGGGEVRTIMGDIATLPDHAIPPKIAACLIDIDLAEPIYSALCRIYPRLVPGGIVIVDDCDDHTQYKARIGYDRFVLEQGLVSEIKHGKGLIKKPKMISSSAQDKAAAVLESVMRPA